LSAVQYLNFGWLICCRVQDKGIGSQWLSGK
jgi:hypothetical protein